MYEGPLWFPIALKLLGGSDAPSLEAIVRMASERMSSVDGQILDVATGTGTIGRHVAGSRREVYGIDISAEMLRQGRRLSAAEGVHAMHFARADAQALPFNALSFDGCLFCGSLHLFSDTRKVLEEVGRTLKPGAPMVVTTVIHGDRGLFKAQRRGGPARCPR